MGTQILKSKHRAMRLFAKGGHATHAALYWLVVKGHLNSEWIYEFIVSPKIQTLLFHSPAQTTAHSPELIFHIMKSRDQTSVLLSVAYLLFWREILFKIAISIWSIAIVPRSTVSRDIVERGMNAIGHFSIFSVIIVIWVNKKKCPSKVINSQKHTLRLKWGQIVSWIRLRPLK